MSLDNIFNFLFKSKIISLIPYFIFDSYIPNEVYVGIVKFVITILDLIFFVTISIKFFISLNFLAAYFFFSSSELIFEK